MNTAHLPDPESARPESPLALALRYMEIFYGGGSLEPLAEIFADDLTFEGPLYTFDSAAAYLDALRRDPPAHMDYEILASFETETAACLVYRFTKPGVATPMAQLFEVAAGKIRAILLVFDTRAFASG